VPIFFVGYTVLVWAFVIRYRRTMTVLVPLLGGIGGLLAINAAHYYISIATDGAIDLPMVQTLMYPYTILVALGGAYLALLPRGHGRGRGCVSCGYDLAGLHETDAGERRCPECGTMQPGRNRYRPAGVDPDDLEPAPSASPADQPHQRPGPEDPRRHPAEQDPADQTHLVR